MVTLKKTFFIILSIISSSALIIYTLYSLTDIPNTNNNFKRDIIQPPATLLHSAPKNKNIQSICGITDQYLYFQNTDLKTLTITQKNIENQYTKELKVNPKEILDRTFEVKIDSPYIYIYVDSKPIIFSYSLINDSLLSSFHPPALFTRGVGINGNKFFIRGFDTLLKSRDQIFMASDSINSFSKKEKNISERMDDGGIATDGELLYDTKNGLLIYTSFYSNRILCMDTSINIKYKGKTIDQTNTFQAQSGELKYKTGKTTIQTNSSPSRLINLASVLNNGKLYILSLLKADNQTEKEFNRNDILDVYETITGKYKYSIKIPFYKRQKILYFDIKDNFLVAVYREYIVTYRLPIPNH
ncbi:hypothetical protein [Chitinophaga nivalis]|uniref:Uncharacterized protein n=1 Tax=Chitinophaga nivalis TaxID=2991709 RepID=A0ABT3IQF3_9BACT|nr:hypothetical protein [Chitinophaga nivalis]MCW3464111.1 hypothetical protein [Chitinophaga nivalis]MCW3486199.1 hypothetical protein [Chitinophaga nivalis]